MPDKKKTAPKGKHTFKRTPAKTGVKPPKAKNKVKSEIKMEHSMVEIMAIGETTKLVEQPQNEATENPGVQKEQAKVAESPLEPLETSQTTENSAPVSEEASKPTPTHDYTAAKQVQEQVEQTEVDKKIDEELGEGASDENTTEEKVADSEPVSSGDVTVVEEGGGLKWLLILVILFLVGMIGGLGYLFVFQNKPVNTTAPSSSSTSLKTVKVLNPSPTSKAVAKNTYTIEVLNGSGVSGAAGTGQTYLKGLGYNVSGVGNADNSNYADTVIKAKTNVSSAFIAQLRSDLAGKYTMANSLTSLANSSTTDVEVIVGSR